MHNTTCLNCDTVLTGKFCQECGQKADTHRITPKHFVIHDLGHGVFHIDKGILFTIRQTFTRPGYAALEYVAGKRKNYYNIFYLIFLILGFYLIANGHEATVKEATKNLSKFPVAVRDIIMFLVVYTKYLILLVIPVLALSSFIIFLRLNFNYAEHIILAGFVTLGSFVFLLLSALIGPFYPVLSIVTVLLGPSLFTVWVYYQATKKYYTILEYMWRVISFFLLSIIWIFFLCIILVMSFFRF